MAGYFSLIKGKLAEDPISVGVATFLNPYSYLKLRKHPELLEAMDAIYLDGAALVLAFKIMNLKVRRRSMDMTSLFPVVTKQARDENRLVYLIGGEEGVSERAASVLGEHLSTLNVITKCGFFPTPRDLESVVKEISLASRDPLVLVGMGALAQEQFLRVLQESQFTGTAYSCGGFLHQTAMTESGEYYPHLVNKLNLRWLYRIAKEPSVLPRYLFHYPWFLIVFCIDAVEYRFRELH